MDMHDISRISATYGLGGYFVIHPDEKMRNIAHKLSGHWTTGDGKNRNSDRYDAIKNMKIVPDLDAAKTEIKKIHGEEPVTIGTTARKKEKSKPLSHILKQKKSPFLILFGTAGGIEDNFLDSLDIILEPIVTGSGYNHLSVRSAVSIFIDRIYMSDYYR